MVVKYTIHAFDCRNALLSFYVRVSYHPRLKFVIELAHLQIIRNIFDSAIFTEIIEFIETFAHPTDHAKLLLKTSRKECKYETHILEASLEG